MHVYVDPSFYLAETIQRYQDRMRKGVQCSPAAKSIITQNAGMDPSSPEFLQQLEAQVYHALEQTLQRWRGQEIKTPACLREVASHCAQECWSTVFVLASGTALLELSSHASGLGYPVAPLLHQTCENTTRFFEPLGLLPLRVPPIMDLIGPLAELDGVTAIYDAEKPVHLFPPPSEPVSALLAESVSAIDPGRIRERIGLDRCGRGVRVCVCDTGIDAAHPDLAGAVESAIDLTDEGDGIDHNGHGTHVAGIIAGRGKASNGRYMGVAPGATLLSARVLNSQGSGSTFTVISGLKWALDQGAHVVNLSLGHNSAVTDGQSLESRICNALVERGVVVVASAGNSGPDPATIGVPGDARDVITVGALSRVRAICAFSSRGPTSNPELTGPKPDVVAPGDQVVSCRSTASDPVHWRPVPGADSYAAASGTSMAAPIVSGAAAVLLGEAKASGIALLPLELKRRLCGTCCVLPGVPSESQGHGIVNLTAASQTHTDTESAMFGESERPHEKRTALEVKNDILSVEELSEYLKLKPVTLYKLLRQGKVPGFKVGGAWRFRKATIDEWIARREQSGEIEMEEEKAAAPTAFSVECGLCGIRLKAVPANRCEADGCDVPVCDKCWNIHARHFCKDHRSQQHASPYVAESVPSASDAGSERCCLCGERLDISSKRCQESGCWNLICKLCWNGKSAGWVGHPRHYCTEHRYGHWGAADVPEQPQAGWPPAPSVPVPVRNTADSALPLVAAESAFIERIRTQFAETKELYHPSTGKPVSSEGAWTFIKEESELNDILRHPEFRLDAHNLAERFPTNRSLTHSLKVPRGVLDKKSVTLVVKAKFWVGWEDLLAGRVLTRPRTMTELSGLLSEVVAKARKQKQRVVLALFSPIGWEPEAIHYVVPDSASPSRFASPDVSVVLLGSNAQECYFDATDVRAAFCAPLVQGELPRDVLRRCQEAVNEHLAGAKYVTLEALAVELPFSIAVIRTVMERLASASSELKMETISGVGPTLRRA